MDAITIGLIAVVFISFIPLSCFGEEPPPKRAGRRALVRQFVLSSAPKRDRPLELEVTNFDVKRLWEEMKLQVFDVQYGTRVRAIVIANIQEMGSLPSITAEGSSP